MVSIAKTDLKTAQSSLRWKSPRIMLDKCARVVTDGNGRSTGAFSEAL
jgi:hypothetical protein